MNIICFSDINWNFLWQRHQQMLTRFPNDWKILYVQPSFVGLLIKNPREIFPKRVQNNIYTISFPTIPLFDRISILRTINDFLIVFWARFFISVYSLNNPAIILYEPRFSCVAGKLKECLICFKVIDDRMEFTEVPRWIRKHIDFLIHKADIIVVSSQHLFNKIENMRKHNVFLVGNGVEVEHFEKAMGNIKIPVDILDINKPILGYVGAIGEWFDFQLIECILQSFKNVSIVLIGPVFPKQKVKINRLKDLYPNIFVLGHKPYSSLPNYIKAFNVCIIPFKINELTLSVNPNKLYEYLAAGKPVISTALPEVKKYDGTVYIAEKTSEFLDHINKALNTHDSDNFLRIANDNAWNEKAKIVMNLIMKYKRNYCE